ncbi:MAG: hypothetical protein F6K65_21450 [Moorea sp. SIO3C2]|nr:hypothetical protein [Moorena sp. SIO3C2]
MEFPHSLDFRRIESCSSLLATYGAKAEEIEELLAYNENVFHDPDLDPQSFPLAPEPHVAAWEGYHTQAQEVGVFETLRSHLVQLQFPIKPGISQTLAYQGATRRGQPTIGMLEATGLALEQPDSLQLIIHPSAAGAIPVIIASCQKDFVGLVQALTKHNEPQPIPDSMGAAIVGGYNNWNRIRHYRRIWEAQQSQPVSEAAWSAEFKRIIPQKHLYQDRFIILSQGNYSAVSASEMGMPESQWRKLSLTIRLEHECTHYFTRRVLGSMRNNLLDELIADYQGIVAANYGYYRADWFLTFMGLESFPDYRAGGRLENYRAEATLSEGAFRILQRLVKDAAENLEAFNLAHQNQLQGRSNQGKMVMALTRLRLEELADKRHNFLEEIWQKV